MNFYETKMKTKMKIILIYLTIFLTTVSFRQQLQKDNLTLKDVIKLTVENHPLIKQKQEELYGAEFRVEQQKSSYLPNVVGQASYTRISPIPEFSFGGQTIELAPANNYSIGVFVHQTLYDFGKRDAQVDYASSFLQSIKDNEELVKTDLSNQAIKIFYGILFLEKSITVKDTQFAALQEHLRIIEIKIKDYAATNYDVLSTKTRMMEIKNEKIELLNEKNKQEQYLKELIGEDRKREILLSGNFNLPELSFNEDSLLNLANNQRQELKSAMDIRQSAVMQKEMLSKNDNLIFNADVGYGFKNGYEPNLFVIRGNWFASVSASVPIFNGNLTENKIKESMAAIKMDEEKINQIKESIKTDVYQSLSDLKSSTEKIKSTSEQIEYAKKSLELAKIQYERGVVTNLEVLDAETALAQARLLNFQALYKNIINYYALRKAAGDKVYSY